MYLSDEASNKLNRFFQVSSRHFCKTRTEVKDNISDTRKVYLQYSSITF